jgi:hypothetical protein
MFTVAVVFFALATFIGLFVQTGEFRTRAVIWCLFIAALAILIPRVHSLLGAL